MYFSADQTPFLPIIVSKLSLIPLWQVNAMPTLSLSSFVAVTDEPEANNMTPRPAH